RLSRTGLPGRSRAFQALQEIDERPPLHNKGLSNLVPIGSVQEPDRLPAAQIEHTLDGRAVEKGRSVDLRQVRHDIRNTGVPGLSLWHGGSEQHTTRNDVTARLCLIGHDAR